MIKFPRVLVQLLDRRKWEVPCERTLVLTSATTANGTNLQLLNAA